MESELSWIGTMIFLGGLLLLIMLQINNLRVMNETLKGIAESRGAQTTPTLPPPVLAPAQPKDAVYKV